MKIPAFKWFCIVLLLQSTLLLAQSGHPYLSHFSPDNSLFDNQNFAILEDKQGTMIMGNRKGMLTFDGNNWGFIKTGSTPRSLALDTATGRIYVGLKNEYGYIEPGDKGDYRYINVSGRGTYFGYYTQTVIAEGYAWFCSELSLARVSLSDPKDQYKWVATEAHPFGGIYISEGKIHLIKMGFGVFTMDKNKQTKIQKADALTKVGLLKQLLLTNDKSLLLTIDNRRFLLEKGKPEPYLCDADDYLEENFTTSGKRFDADHVVIGTRTGGIVKIKVSTGQTTHIINFQNGLPDDEVLALGLDSFKGIWIAHEYGLSRADFDIPVSTFHTYPGLQGSITTAYEFQGKLFTGTTNGLYVLDKVEDYKEVAVWVKRKVREKIKPMTEKSLRKSFIDKQPITQAPIPIEEEKPEKKQEKKRAKRKKLKQEVKSAAAPTLQKQESEESPSTKTAIRYKTINELQKTKVLQSISYVFKRVEGFDEKVKALHEIDQRLFAGTTNGLYEIKGLKGIPVLEDLSVLTLLVTESGDHLLAGTSRGAYLFDASKEEINYRPLLSEEMPIHSILEDKTGSLWLGGENQVFVISDFKHQKTSLDQTIDFLNSYSEEISIRLVNDKVGVFFSDGLYYPDRNTGALLQDSTYILEKKGQFKVIYGAGNETWVYNGKEWTVINLSKPGLEGLSRFIEMFEQVQLIQTGPSGNLWITDKANRIFNLKADKNFRLDTSFKAHIIRIRDQASQSLPLQNLKLNYGNNALSFFFSAPFYVGQTGAQFSYYLMGISKEWSEWSGNSIVDFPFLPDGEYELRIKAKNVLGQITEESTLAFEILPPYWRTWWFYILEVVFFSTLLALSVFFNKSNESSFLSKSLTFLTLIVFIEALHVSISVIFDLEFDDSPVLQFLMNVSLALLISPFERILTRIIRRRSIAQE